MSFSSKTKNELTRMIGEDKCCQIAELSALIKVSGTLSLSGYKRIDLTIVTENPAIARRVFSLLKKVFAINSEIHVKQNKNLKKTNTYLIQIPDATVLLEQLGILETEESLFGIRDGVSEAIVKKECCKRAYLRGAFLGGGSLSDPEKGYHAELVTHQLAFAEALVGLLANYDLVGKIIERKNQYVVYLKEGDQIVDLLNVIGAHSTLLEFENIRIIKQMRNDVNRLVNCETANMNKTVDASYRQVEDIKYIIETAGIEYLPDSLRALAELRLENNEMSLKEIGELLEPPVGKSGVNHRFRKIEQMAAELRGSSRS